MSDQQWNGPGKHGFVDLLQILDSIGDLDRFLTRKESLCILRNPVLFAQDGHVLDAIDDRNRPDYEFLVVDRPTLMQLNLNAGIVGDDKLPGY
jgi:hypothetical protein